MDYKAGVCNFCGTGCGNYLRITDGRITGVYSSRNHPVSKGRLCVRGWHIHEWLMTDQRIDAPMIRINGSLKKVSYDEAADFLMQKMSVYSGAESDKVGFLASPRWSNENNYLFMKLARGVFKTNNVTLDSESGHRGSLNVLAEGAGFPGMTGSLEDIAGTAFILIVGSDITKMNPVIGSEIHRARMSGTKVVTICSRSTQMAKLSDVHIQINPGSKKVVLAAMAKAAILQGMADSDYIKMSTEGFENFSKSVEDLTPEKIKSLTGIEYDVIASAASDLFNSESAMAFWSTGIAGPDEDTVSYIYNLFLAAGKIGKENCGVNPVAGITNLQGGYDMGAAPDLLTGFRKLDSTDTAEFEKAWGTAINKKPGRDIYNLLDNKNSGLKALIVADHDEGIIRYKKEIEALEFVAYFGSYDNPFIELADVVFPLAALIEDDGTYTNTERRVQLSGKHLEPFNSVLPGWKLFPLIASKYSQNWNYSSAEDVFKEIVSLTPSYSGLSYSRLADSTGIQWPCNKQYPDGCRRLEMTNGDRKFRFTPVSGNYAVPAVSDEFPFLLIRAQGEHFWHQNNIMKKSYIPKREYNATLLVYPKGYVEICKEDAKKLQVREHWIVRIVSPNGSMNVGVKVSDDVKPGTAYVPYFIREMITEFLLEHKGETGRGEDSIIPIRIERV